MSVISLSKIKFPSILVTGSLPKDYSDLSLCADGLEGWALCEMGVDPPENFGKGMVVIGKELGISPTGQGFMDYANSKM